MSALLDTYAAWPFELDHGRNDVVVSADGVAYTDWYGGHCVTLTGHCHPHVVGAIKAQADKLLFYSAAARLSIRERAADALIAHLAGAGVERVFFCNSGAEANENALKMALKATGRKRIACFEGGWHGRTLLALSATDDPKIVAPFAPFLVPATQLPFNDIGALLATNFSDIAAVIVEPIQSMSGIRTASSAWWQTLRARTAAAGTWLIIDEIQTGLGRVGASSASLLMGIKPEAMTLAKGLASGMPIGATLFSASAASTIRQGDLGSTFGGGPLAMAALIATLEVIADEDLIERAARTGALLKAQLPGAAVASVLGEGMLLGLRTHEPGASLKKHLYDRRMLVGASGDPHVLRLMPPLTISDDAVAALTSAINELGA